MNSGWRPDAPGRAVGPSAEQHTGHPVVCKQLYGDHQLQLWVVVTAFGAARLDAGLQQLHEPRGATRHIVVAQPGVEALSYGTVSGARDFHVATSQLPGGVFGGFHERMPDPLPSACVSHHKGHQSATSRCVLQQWDGVNGRDTRDAGAHLCHEESVLHVFQPVPQSGRHVVSARRVSQFVEQGGDRAGISKVSRSDGSRHGRQFCTAARVHCWDISRHKGAGRRPSPAGRGVSKLGVAV